MILPQPHIDGKLIAAAEERFVRDKHVQNHALRVGEVLPWSRPASSLPTLTWWRSRSPQRSAVRRARWHYAKALLVRPGSRPRRDLMGNRRYKRYRNRSSGAWSNWASIEENQDRAG